MRLALAPALLALACMSSSPAAATPRGKAPPPRQRGIALGLFSEDAGWSYSPLLDEIAATGADHVELVVAWYLDDVHATDVREHPRYTAPLPAVERAVRDAHARGLAVFLFPILRLRHQADPSEWRGTLAPRDPAALFASYQRALVALAALAERQRVELLSVGSELSTLDTERAAWVPLVRAVRAVYRGPLTYSGNWDHFQKVALYDLVDFAGLCGYFALSDEPHVAEPHVAEPRVAEPHVARPHAIDPLVAAWRRRRVELEAFSVRVGRPILFTEIGYLSQRGAAAWPWNEGAAEPVDLEEQRRCYAAFRAAWSDAPPSLLAGVYFWNWYGWGGPSSGGYTPRGKPAAVEIRAFFKAR